MTNKIKPSAWRITEFSVLVIISVVMIFISVNSFVSKEESVNGFLADYKCERWKESALIYSHQVYLTDGRKFAIRTKDIICNKDINPKLGLPTHLIVKGNKLLSMSQSDVEILQYEILVKDSKGSFTIVWVFTIVFLLATLWSGFRLRYLFVAKK